MKFPQTPEDVKSEIVISSDKADGLGDLRIRQLINVLTKVDHELIVEGVIRVFEMEDRPDKMYQDQEFAGRVLRDINPRYLRELSGILKRTIKTWNKSVEQLPFWFRDNYGIEQVKVAFNNFDKMDLSAREKEKIETMRFWLRL